MKTRIFFLVLVLAVCLGAGHCAHNGGVKGSLISYGTYEFKMHMKPSKAKKNRDRSKISMEVKIITTLKQQSHTISIKSIKKNPFGYEFIVEGCGQKELAINFLVESADKVIDDNILRLKCGQKRMALWHSWKNLKAQGLLNQPIFFSAKYEGKQLFKFDVTFVE